MAGARATAPAFVYQNASTETTIYVILGQTPFAQATPAPASSTARVNGLSIFLATIPPMIIIGADPALVAGIGSRLT